MDERISSKIADSSPTDIVEGLPPLANQSAVPLRDIRAAEPTFMEVFFAWEKLRILYNGLLILVVLVRIESNLQLFFFFLEPAIYANLCFCAGPVAEGYLTLIGLPRQQFRWLIFWVGFFITFALAIIYTHGIHFP